MGLLDRFRRAPAASRSLVRGVTEQRTDEKNIPPIGAAGTINYEGLLQPSEYNYELTGLAALEVWERMRRSDPAVREALWHIFAPIQNADVTIEPPVDPADDELEITEFARSALFDWMDQPFEEFQTQLLSYLTMGHSVFEPLYKVVTRSLRVVRRIDEAEKQETLEEIEGKPKPTSKPVTAEGNTPPTSEKPGPPDPIENVPTPTIPKPEAEILPPRQFVTWRKFSQRLPTTVVRWNVDPSGELKSIMQQVAKTHEDGRQTYEEIEIPASHLLIFVNEKWGDEWTGLSILRAAYKPWVLKETIEKIAGIAYERHGVGIPVGYVPRDRENDTAVLNLIENMLTNLRAGEFSFMLFPGPKTTGNVPGYDFEIVAPPGGIPDFTKILEYLRGEIKGAMLVRFSELGHGSTGARATANVQSEVWRAALHSIARYIERVMNEALRRLVDLNYPDVQRYPTIKFSGIEERNMLEFSQSVALLLNAKALDPDSPLREWVREAIDAPAEDPDEADLRAETQRQEFALDKGERSGVFEIEDDPAQTTRPRVSKAATGEDEPLALEAVAAADPLTLELHVHDAERAPELPAPEKRSFRIQRDDDGRPTGLEEL